MSRTDFRNRSAALVATWFGCGYFPVAPGTVASVAAAGIAWALGVWSGWTPAAVGALGVIMFFPAVWTAEVTALNMGTKDPGMVVIDEVVGQWITLLGAPVIDWKTCVAGLVVFRILDIWKPFPARRLEQLPGGLGIVTDDVMAGAYGALVLFALGWFNLY